MKDLLLQERDRGDVTGDTFDDLGFGVGVWNRARAAVGFSATVGAYPRVPGVLNRVVVDLPPADEGASYYSPGTARSIFAALVEAWQPDWATWTTRSWRSAQSSEPRAPVVGWMTYLRGEQPGLFEGAIQLGEGSLIEAASEFSEVDANRVLSIRDGLARQSALQPIPFESPRVD